MLLPTCNGESVVVEGLVYGDFLLTRKKVITNDVPLLRGALLDYHWSESSP